MKTIKIIITFAAFIFIAFPLLAQDTTKPFYFPHKTGDMWEYFYDDYSPMYVDTLQNFTILDSTDFNGIIYIKQHARFINPTLPSVLISDTTRYLIDTVNNYVYGGEFSNDSAIAYKLNAKEGEQWVVYNHGLSPIARVTAKWKGSLFGTNTTFMNVFYFSASDSTDTTGYSVYGSDVIADGFGLISRGGGELVGEIHLIGAVINGFLYGDTTLTSIKDNKSIMPSSVKLYPNYPNPFNPSTTISFELLNPSKISLIIYDILGRETKRLIDNRYYSTGLHKLVWDGAERNGHRATSGVYIYRLITDKQTLTNSMILLK